MEEIPMKNMLPAAYVESIKKMLPETEWEAFLNSYGQPAVHGLRLNPLKGKTEPFRSDMEPVPWCDTGFYYEESVWRPGKHVYHDAGVYYIQEPSAMLTAELADVKPGERVLDLCAAPGGKSTQLAGKLQGQGLLIANEIHGGRAAILSQNIERMGVANAVVTNHAPEELTKHFPGFFDKIIVDAPCSGEGMFRKNPEAISQWSMENVQMCAKRQLFILEQAVKMLQPGGTIVYSTCTFAEEEDEQVIAAFLDTHADFTLCHQRRIWPHKEKGEGHFAAVLRQERVAENKAETVPAAAKMQGKKAKKRKKEAGLSKQQKQQYVAFVQQLLKGEEWTSQDTLDRLIWFGDQLYLLPCQMPSLQGLRVLRPGLQIAVLKKDRLEPAHALAMACRPEQVSQSLEAGGEQAALAYQMGQTLPCEKTGWVLVCTDGYSMGWGKASAGVCKNHYPKGLRRSSVVVN